MDTQKPTGDIPEEVFQKLDYASCWLSILTPKFDLVFSSTRFWKRSYLLWGVSSWNTFYCIQVKKAMLITSHSVLLKELCVNQENVTSGTNVDKRIVGLRNELNFSILVF
ncbi:hypothetical protein BC938DRAFT_479852 [Jimgerdemannia flammicorona]|uniref:Uncharacterized protein n=1 Tax=Jimgerdemannia flammicorona TaxID=994334 RepID=A0A433QXL0_9FUNG|nr:hypothetical protein BC938DRAFT_479852 [Jimgerdemannia flammicorona]